MKTKIVHVALCMMAIMALSFTVTAQTTQPADTSADEDVTKKYPGIAVVELFTSEGCSSCPPAEKFLGQVAKSAHEQNLKLYALQWHVDYWDRLGWKDPFGSAAHSERQRRYTAQVPNRKHGRWTPQLITNGKTYFSGNDWTKSFSSEMSTRPQSTITTSAVADGKNAVSITVEIENAPEGQELVVVIAENELSSDVTAGENKGKTLTHTGVVRAHEIVKLDEQTLVIKMDIPEAITRENAFILAYIQNPEDMTISNAAPADLPSPALESSDTGTGSKAGLFKELDNTIMDQQITQDMDQTSGECTCESGVCAPKE